MKQFVTGQARGQCTLFPECLEDFVSEDNPVRVVDLFVEGLDLRGLGFTRVDPLATGRPAYHPAILLKLYIYGYLNRVQSSRRLERESRSLSRKMSHKSGCFFCGIDLYFGRSSWVEEDDCFGFPVSC